MAIKSIEELVIKIKSSSEEDAKGWLRDYFAHKVMQFESRSMYGMHRDCSIDFFNYVFKDVPAFKKGSVK
jgi:hypothetical protein